MGKGARSSLHPARPSSPVLWGPSRWAWSLGGFYKSQLTAARPRRGFVVPWAPRARAQPLCAPASLHPAPALRCCPRRSVSPAHEILCLWIYLRAPRLGVKGAGRQRSRGGWGLRVPGSRLHSHKGPSRHGPATWRQVRCLLGGGMWAETPPPPSIPSAFRESLRMANGVGLNKPTETGEEPPPSRLLLPRHPPPPLLGARLVRLVAPPERGGAVATSGNSWVLAA